MAHVIDITSKIKNESKFIVYNGKQYKVDDRKNTIVEVFALLEGVENTDISIIDEIMGKLLGPEAIADFANFNYEDYLIPFFAAMACVQGKSYEEVEASFHNREDTF